jgi:hypothetical protein
MRMGELAGSLSASAILIGALTLPIAAITGLDASRDTSSVVLLFAATLATAWGALLASKPLEGSKLDEAARRTLNLIVGGFVGLGAAQLASWLQIAFTPTDRPPLFAGGARLTPLGGFIAFFALAFLANGWWKLTDRDRPARVRIWPVALAGVVAVALTPIWPQQELWVESSIPVAALVVQLVSPWSRDAAAYARYSRKTA